MLIPNARQPVNAQLPRGKFITLEGVDGAGKSTHLDWLIQQLQNRGLSVIQTREPGGTELGEALRQILLNQPMSLKTETLLMFAARSEHIALVIEPALAAGQWVVCDRFTDATYAYQGGGRELGSACITALERWVHPDLQPDLTWLFDLPLALARQRLQAGCNLDRFEQEAEDFFQRVRTGYHERVQQNPERFYVVDSSLSIPEIHDVLLKQIEQWFKPST